MQRLVCLIGLLLVTNITCAAESWFVTPKTTSLKYSYSEDKYAKDYFEGEITISGKFVFQKNEYDDWIEIHFVPDKSSTFRLPYKKGLGLVTDLFVEEDERKSVLANELLPKKYRDKILSGIFSKVEMNSSVVITNYRAQVDCGHTYYYVRLMRIVRKTGHLRPDVTPAKNGNCG
jgi:hypothetical protein